MDSYDRFLLRTLATLGYTGWSFYAGLSLLLSSPSLLASSSQSFFRIITHVLDVLILLVYIFLYAQSSPWTYYLYTWFAVFFWRSILSRLLYLRFEGRAGKGKWKWKSVMRIAIWTLGTVASLLGMVVCISFPLVTSFHSLARMNGKLNK